MRKIIILIVLVCTIFLSEQVFSQRLSKDNIAESKIIEGKKYMQLKNYSVAEQCFEFAAMRPINTATTTAIYLSGLAAWYQKNTTNAYYRFHQLIIQYPQSKYVHDAMYHLAIQQLVAKENRQHLDGIRLLYKLRDGISAGVSPILSLDAANQLKSFLFGNAEAETLILYYAEAKPLYQKELTEAICYQLTKTNRQQEGKRFYTEYLNSGGNQSVFVEQLLNKPAIQGYNKPAIESGVKKIGLMLPFFSSAFEPDTLNFIPAQSRAALSLYEGIEEALEESESELNSRYILKVWDTNRDPITVQAQLTEMEAFQPDVIIGEIYNKQSRVIADWAEARGIPQIIPLSPAKSLIENRKEVFLMNPSTVTHGRKLAEFVFRDQGVRDAVVWTDGKSATNDIANAFAYQLKIMGGSATILTVDSVFNNNVISMVNQNKSLMSEAQAIYIPIGNEEILGLLLGVLDAQKWKPKILTAPDIQHFEHIETELKQRLRVIFTQNYFVEENSQGYETYLNQHLLRLNSPPDEYHIRGYDLGIYLLSVLEYNQSGRVDLSQKIRDFLPIRGLGNAFHFDREQDNQSIFILQYQQEGVVKLK